jgi:O-methyltransferase
MILKKFFNRRYKNEKTFRKEFYEIAYNYLRHNNAITGSYLEFGVYSGTTFDLALNILGEKSNQIINHFYAFDSFKGMPELKGIDDHRIWKKNKNIFSIPEFKKKFYKNLARITMIEGYYENSLKNFQLHNNHKDVALAYIDCDYYSSTKTVLDWLKNNLNHGMIIALDDWDLYFGDPLRGQKKAFKEFQESCNDWDFQEFFRIKSGGNSFIALEKSKIGKEIL